MAQRSRRPWRIVILLVVSVAINYIDRGNLSIAAPILEREMGISASQLGVLLSSFFWTYALFQLVSGWLVDRFDEAHGISAMERTTGYSLAITGLMQAAGAVKPAGVHTPDEAVPGEQYVAELSKRGIAIAYRAG